MNGKLPQSNECGNQSRLHCTYRWIVGPTARVHATSRQAFALPAWSVVRPPPKSMVNGPSTTFISEPPAVISEPPAVAGTLCEDCRIIVRTFVKSFFIAKTSCTYTMNYLRQEKCLRDHGA
jgi:hypothetical protein